MIEIKKENVYKVLKPEAFSLESKLLGKYQLWENNAVKPMKLCFIKSFGPKDKKGYGIETTIWLGYTAEKQ